MENFKDLISEAKEVTDITILKKVAKKAFGGHFKKVVDQKDGYYTIVLDTDVISFKDLKVLEVHTSSSFEIDNIDLDDRDILVRRK